jgi:hypothetical protein
MCARLRAGPPDFEATVANAMRTSVVTRNSLSKNNSDAAINIATRASGTAATTATSAFSFCRSSHSP